MNEFSHNGEEAARKSVRICMQAVTLTDVILSVALPGGVGTLQGSPSLSWKLNSFIQSVKKVYVVLL